MGRKKRPICVGISDVHYRVDTLKLADAAMRQAIEKAVELRLPLVVFGDLNDTKALIRGEVANALIETMQYAKSNDVLVVVLTGNHDMLNEKSEANSLEFLRPYCEVVSRTDRFPLSGVHIAWIPYQCRADYFIAALKRTATSGDLVFCHQGMLGADMGGYMQDHSAITPKDVENFTCISGHYHKHHTVGTLTYIGNPYTLTFGEANDGPKGFQIIYSDGSMEMVESSLRRHRVIDVKCSELHELPHLDKYMLGDLIWLKLHGTAAELEDITKADMVELLGRHSFKFDKIVEASEQVVAGKVAGKTDGEVMDVLIDESKESPAFKKSVKALWRELMS